MFSFAYPYLLFLLLLIPFFFLLYIWMRKARKRKLRIFGRPEIIAPLMPGVSKYKSSVKFGLMMVALTCIIFALARPRGGLVSVESQRVGMEIVMTVDASNSMLASTTTNPNDASRMTTAKVMLERLIDNMSNNRIGLVVFAGEAYQLIPASTDFTSAKSFLNSISPSEMPVEGTDIKSAIQVAQASFSKDKDVAKAIILLTDVEELDDPQAAIGAVKEAAKNGIQVDVIGVGSTQPVTIPYENGYFRDENGEIVKTGLNSDLGEKLAKAGNGVFVNASSPDAMSMIQKQLRTLKQKTLSKGTHGVHVELYIYFAIAALVFLCLDAFIGMGKNQLLSRISFFSNKRSIFSPRKS